MAFRLLPAIQQVFSDIGEIGIGYKLKTYQTLTTTPLATYSNEALSIANANPASGATTGNQIADENGRFGDMWVDALASYKIVLTDADDVELVTADPVDGSQSSSLTVFDPIPEAFWGTTAGTSSAYTLDSNVDISTIGYQSTQIFELVFHTACAAAPTLAIDGLTALNLKKYSGSGTKVALIAGDVQNQTYLARNDGTDIIILNPEHPSNFPANTTVWRGLTYLPSQVTISINGSDANNDMDFSAGVFQFSDGSGQAIATALTKRLDASWAAGTNQGGLDTGSKASNTYYYLYCIYNPTTSVSDALFSASPTSPTLPSGYTKYYRVGSILTDGSSNINSKFLGQSTPNGQIVRFQTGETASASLSGATLIALDDSKPQITEGFEVMACAIAPFSATKKLKIESVFNFNANATADAITQALFQDSTADSLAAVGTTELASTFIQQLTLTYHMVAGTTSATTLRIRGGSSANATLYFNGNSSGRRYGGAMASSITITEY